MKAFRRAARHDGVNVGFPSTFHKMPRRMLPVP